VFLSTCLLSPDRAHRIGQASAVNVYFLHVRNSVDDIIWQSVQNKLENVGQALDGEDRAMQVAGARTMPEKGTLYTFSPLESAHFLSAQVFFPTARMPQKSKLLTRLVLFSCLSSFGCRPNGLGWICDSHQKAFGFHRSTGGHPSWQ